MSLLLKNATVVNAEITLKNTDVLIEGGKFAAIGKDLEAPEGSRVIDCTVGFSLAFSDKLVIPGGIDPHTHFALPFMGETAIDDWAKGPRAALAGGTTTVIDFVIPSPGESLIAAFDKWSGWAKESVMDYGFHTAITWWSDSVKEEMGILARERGVASFKHFMAYKGSLMLSDESLFESFTRCRELGAVPQVHAENGEMVVRGQQALLAKGITGPEGHPWSRPPEVEGESCNRAAVIADNLNVPLYIVHCSTKQSVDVLSAARKAGQRIYGEALAGHLTIDDSVYYKGTWAEAASFVMSPPFRPPEHQVALWSGLASGVIQTTATDNCTFCETQKMLGKDDFSKIPNGTNGVEDRLSILYTHGVLTGKLTLNEYVATTSTNSAKIFGLYPRKVGSDADVAILDPNLKRTISKDTHYQAVDRNIWEGWEVSGVTVYTISRGDVVWEAKVENGVVDWQGGKLTEDKGRGKYLPRKTFSAPFDGMDLKAKMNEKKPIVRSA